MQEISCVLCRDSASRPLIHESGYTGRQCSTCGLIFISPRPDPEEIEAIYREGEAHLSQEWWLQRFPSPAAWLQARHDVATVRRHQPGGSLLEIGPGRGTFLAAAARAGYDAVGVELNPAQAELIRASHGLACVESLDAAAQMRPDGFDVVYHCDVISHFHDPHREMGRIRDLLRPGGYHVFETGNLADVDHRYLRLVRSFQYPDHLFFYGDRSLDLLLEQTGFERVATHRRSILADRLIRAAIGRVAAAARRRAGDRPGDGGTPGPGPQGAAASPPSTAGQAARAALDLFYHGLHETAGRLPAGPRTPQTLVVVARRA